MQAMSFRDGTSSLSSGVYLVRQSFLDYHITQGGVQIVLFLALSAFLLFGNFIPGYVTKLAIHVDLLLGC